MVGGLWDRVKVKGLFLDEVRVGRDREKFERDSQLLLQRFWRRRMRERGAGMVLGGGGK